MGRRSTSSTKSGKFMNPTDQARKEARKRELKKNKKQRMMVRTAVLKMKDPRQIIKDMEKLDEMEFNPVQQPLLNEKVLRDKRKKLRETFERIVRLYERENPDTYKELRKLELDYESNRGKLSLYFDSVKNAELVEVDSIPLPEMPHAPSSILIQDIPLPGAQPPSILKKGSSLSKGISASMSAAVAGVPRLPPGRKPPGPPTGPPPSQVLALYASRRAQFAADADASNQASDMEKAMDTMLMGGERDSGSESDGDDGEEDDSDSEEDSEGERDDGGEVDKRMMVDRQEDDREKGREEDRGDRHAGRSVRFADMPPSAPREKSKKKRIVKKKKAITPLQAMMLRMAGQSIPEEEEEEEEVEEEYTDSDDSDIEDRGPPGDNQSHLIPNQRMPPPSGPMGGQQPPLHMQGPPGTGPPPLGPPPAPPMRPPGPPSGLPPGPPPGAPPFLRPPGMLGGPRGPMPRLLPPGPPPGRPPGPPPGPPPGLPPGPPPRGPPPRLPPPAPPGMCIPPPPRSGPPRQLAPPLSLFPPPLNSVLSAPPSIVHRQKPGSNPDGSQSNPNASMLPPPSMPIHHHAPTIEKRANITSVSAGGSNLTTGQGSGGATISAKPQIINPKTEVTRFVPTALRVRRDKGAGSGGGPMEKRGRREERVGGQKQQSMAAPMGSANPTQMGPVSQPNMKTKDQMYEAFMREMEGLL
ncbi:WW domain-binding protein 11 isoform X2 [Salmo salar]|uniref:WW domain-binding protein 11 isoform X2 n=1 Tax=Salmo salar TaxID=8030 RepID=A0ABM3EJ86_SALSA|nr:WW domain-binding protein 11-like isoform X2 [Salmo salar]